MFEQRDYQQNAITSISEYFRVASGNPVLELPTGSGKSFIQAEFIRQVMQTFPDQRILCLCHVKELIAQNFGELTTLWPAAPAGIYSASLKSRDTKDRVIFAGIQSVHSRAREFGRINLVIIDECHLVSNSGSTMYRRFIDGLLAINPNLKIIGLSATPYRLSGGMLTAGADRLFTDLISAKKLGATLSRLVELGHLAPLVTPSDPLPQLSIDSVGKSGGEFKPGELAKAIHNQLSVTHAACDEIICRGHDRDCWIIFASSVEHCDEISEYLTDAGIEVDVVTGETPAAERDQSIKYLKSGVLRALVSVNVLSTGFNVRQVDLLAMLRPTASASLYVQQAGRGMRTHPGKSDCLVLDFAGNIALHGSVDNVNPPKPPKKRDEPGEAPQKECIKCLMLISASARLCPFCQHEYVFAGPDIDQTASNLAIMGKNPPTIRRVREVRYSIHKKPGKPDSMRVDYYSDILRPFSMWICLFHDGNALTRARRWWLLNVHESGEFVLPETIEQAVEQARAAIIPDWIQTDSTGDYPTIVKVGFDDVAASAG